MSPGKRFSPSAIVALKEALCSIYWFKRDLEGFLKNAVSDKSLVSSIDWNAYKRTIANDIVDMLLANQEKYTGDLTNLFYEITKMSNSSHLERLDGGKEKARVARESIEQLRDTIAIFIMCDRELKSVVCY